MKNAKRSSIECHIYTVVLQTSSKTTRTSIREGFDLSMADRKTDVPKKVDIPKVPQGQHTYLYMDMYI